jgi:predicted dehydrogenase
MNIGIIGAGGIARKMAKTINDMQEATVYAIASRTKEKAVAFANNFDIPKAYGSYEQMVQDPKVDLVYVATPHSHHYEHMKLALENDKPILCEKPFTVNVAQAQEILDLAKKRNVMVAQAMWTRYLPMRVMLNDVLATGIIGEVKSLTANLGDVINHIPRMALPELAGGALLDVGVYTINFALMVLGEEIEKIDSSVIFTTSGVDAQNSITLTYPGNVMAMLHSTQMANTDRIGMIYGTKGFIEVQDIKNPEAIRVYDLANKLIKEIEQPSQITGFEYQVKACIDAINANVIECPQQPHKEILRVMDIMDNLRAQWGLVYPFE